MLETILIVCAPSFFILLGSFTTYIAITRAIARNYGLTFDEANDLLHNMIRKDK